MIVVPALSANLTLGLLWRSASLLSALWSASLRALRGVCGTYTNVSVSLSIPAFGLVSHRDWVWAADCIARGGLALFPACFLASVARSLLNFLISALVSQTWYGFDLTALCSAPPRFLFAVSNHDVSHMGFSLWDSSKLRADLCSGIVPTMSCATFL